MKLSRHHYLFIALVLGFFLGTLLHGSSHWLLLGIDQSVLAPIGQIFLRLIFMVVVPMVFCGLVMGVRDLAAERGLGRVAAKTLFFTLATSTASVIIGISLVNFIKPGKDLVLAPEMAAAQMQQVQKISANAEAAKPFTQTLVELIPRNPLDSAVRALEGEMIAWMIFALIFGVALARVKTKNDAITEVLESVYHTCLKVVDFAMRFAPVAVFALVFSSALKFGPSLLVSLGFYVLAVILGLSIQQFGVYPLILKFFARRSPWEFFKISREVYLTAFGTASSNATLPTSLEVAERGLKLSPKISRFVLTVGSTANQNGTALFEGITVLFLAQVYGINLSTAEQAQVVLMSILAGVGTAGVPGGSLPLIMILLKQVGIPPEGLGIVLGVDRFLDMCRTVVNVSGDLVIAAAVDQSVKGA